MKEGDIYVRDFLLRILDVLAVIGQALFERLESLLALVHIIVDLGKHNIGIVVCLTCLDRLVKGHYRFSQFTLLPVRLPLVPPGT